VEHQLPVDAVHAIIQTFAAVNEERFCFTSC